MTSKTEAAMIRSKLILRADTASNKFEVYTTIHGSGVFRWIDIPKHMYEWYKQQFPGIKEEIIGATPS